MNTINSYQEIFQDTFFIKLLLDIKRKVHSEEAKNYLIEFIKDISTSILYELAVFLDNENILKKSDFFMPNMQSVVRERRQWLKKSVTNSDKIIRKAEIMGIDFTQPIYDINVIIKYNKLLATNFENYDCENDLEFVDGVLRTIELSPYSSFRALGLDNNEMENLYSQCISALENIIKKCERVLSGKRFSYSTYKLFSRNPNLTNYDKLFILQRYRLVSSILKIEELFAHSNIELQAGPFKLSFENFIRKYKAIIIEVIGQDLIKPKSNYLVSLKCEIDANIKAHNFFMINRKLRNNAHYNNIEKLSDHELSCLKKYQNKYLNIILKSFNYNLYVKIEQNDIRMTNFLKYCLAHKITKEVIDKNYQSMYLEFLFTHKIQLEKYS